MTPEKARKDTVSTMLIGRWEQACAKLAALAEAFPEDRFESRPANGVRTGGDVLRHLAFWNRYVADTARGKKADDSANELPKEDYPTKARVLAALEQSAADATAALRETDARNTELLVSFLEHTSEHYGQLVIYARLNGIVPPASRS